MISKTLRLFAVPLTALLLAAAAPAPVKTQVPGYYRMAVGAFEVTALYDGSLRIPASLLHGIDEKSTAALLAREFVDTNGGIRTPVNAYLVNTGEHLVLVDGISADCNRTGAGPLIDNIRAAGYRPEDVDAVLITHMHGDHVCGLSSGTTRLFPKATVYAAEAEDAYWMSPGDGPGKAHAHKGMDPYKAAGVVKTFKPGVELFPGVTALDTHGHTPGHIAYLFESGGQGFVAMGDIVHAQSVQFVRPDVTFGYDSDEKTAFPARIALFDRLAQKGWSFGATHLQFPGLGHIRKEAKAYAYVPVEYAPLP